MKRRLLAFLLAAAALTATAPGHSTILTGVHVNVHGVIANEWFDLAAGLLGGPRPPEARAAPLF